MEQRLRRGIAKKIKENKDNFFPSPLRVLKKFLILSLDEEEEEEE